MALSSKRYKKILSNQSKKREVDEEGGVNSDNVLYRAVESDDNSDEDDD